MIKSMSVDELKELIDNKEKIILVDCREQDEWDEAHIESAKFIPLSRFKELYEAELKNKDAKIVMQCRSGKRSMQACHFLLENDFTDLSNLEGGILEWAGSGYKVVK